MCVCLRTAQVVPSIGMRGINADSEDVVLTPLELAGVEEVARACVACGQSGSGRIWGYKLRVRMVWPCKGESSGVKAISGGIGAPRPQSLVMCLDAGCASSFYVHDSQCT